MSEPRCDRHVGSPYAVRCYACESLAREYDELGLEAEDLKLTQLTPKQGAKS